MSPKTASIVMPLSTLFIFFAVVFINIYLAKRKMGEWKKNTTFFFLRSIATVTPRHTASIWVRLYGYSYDDALHLANFQFVAMCETCVIVPVWFGIASNIQTH